MGNLTQSVTEYYGVADIAQSQLDGLSQRKVAKLTIKTHACGQEDICADGNTHGAKTLCHLRL